MVLDLLVIIVLCVCSAIGYKRGLIKSLVGLFSFIVAIIVARIILSMSIDTVSVLIEKFNIATPGLDGCIQSLFEGDGRLVLFLRGLLCVGGVDNLTFLLVIVDIIGFLAITIVVKKIISLLMLRLCEKLFDAGMVYSVDNLFGTFVGFACGFVLCAAVCFVLIGLNAGVLEGSIDELISQSSLVEYFNVQFGVFEAMVHV